MPTPPTESNISLTGAGLIGRTSGAGVSSRLSAADTRAFCSVYSTAEVDAAVGAKYALPLGGVPLADLSAAVQASLGLADSALQSLPSHGHIIDDVTGLQAALDGKQAAGAYAASVHTHTLSEITDAGTAAALNVGTAANNVVQLDGTGKLPAVDGSQLTNLPGGGGIAGSTGSTDNALLRADGTGGATLQASGITVTDTVSTTIHVTAATAIPLITKGAAGQTANLQEWHTNAGTVQAFVSSAGTMAAVKFSPGGSASISIGQGGSNPIYTLYHTAYEHVLFSSGYTFNSATYCFKRELYSVRQATAGKTIDWIQGQVAGGCMLFFDVSNSGATGDVWNAKVNGVSVAACDTTGKLIGSKLKLTTLPTADPVAAGEVWNDAGTLKISAG